MTWRSRRERNRLPPPDFFDLAGSDPELLNTGRISDPQPEHTPFFRWLARVFTALEARLRARGSTSLRWGIRAAWSLVALIGAFFLMGPVVNQPMTFDEVIASADVGTVDWIATDVQIDYTISRDEDGRFFAEVRERYLANFVNGAEPNIERVLVTEYQGHDAELELTGATVDGEAAQTAVKRGATTTAVTISRADGAELGGVELGGTELDGTRVEIELAYTLQNLVSAQIDDATGRTVEQWSWPLFAPTWPQAMKGIEVSLTLTDEVNDALLRQPRAYIGWLLVSGTEWLTPEAETAAGVRYSFSNDDTLPPNADIWVHASFEPGTFVLPPKTGLFWLQSWGPLLPLAFLGGLMLFALAARRVVWADSVGDPWYLPRSEPPGDLDPALATKLMRRRRHDELVQALAAAPKPLVGREAAQVSNDRITLKSLIKRKMGRSKNKLTASMMRKQARAHENWLRRIAEAGERAGRLGSSYAVALRTAHWDRPDVVVDRGLRWVPDSYLRDTFLLAPLAITLLQWGLLRQLSHQVILLVVWWPAVFVLVSTVLAIVTVAAVLNPRPLTRAGALFMQQLKGINVWARGTRLLERGPVDDPLLPYAVLFEPARQAGQAVTEQAIRDSGDRAIRRRWRTNSYISAPAVLGLVAALAVLAGSIITAVVQTPPYDIDTRHVTQYGNLPDTLYTQVKGFDIEAAVSRGADGQARVDVVEHLTISFDESSARVPQFAKEWPVTRLGQDLGFQLTSVTLDGAAVPYQELAQPDTGSTVMHTQWQEVMQGEHELKIAYTLHSAAVDRSDRNTTEQEIRWPAWLQFWEDSYYTTPSNPFAGKAPVRPIRVQMTVTPELAPLVSRGGWINNEYEQPRIRFESGNTFTSWVNESIKYPDSPQFDGAYDARLGSASTGADGSFVATLDAAELELRPRVYGDEVPEEFTVYPAWNASADKHDLGLTSDLGAVLRFEAGTFEGVEPGAADRYFTQYWAPYSIMLAFGAVVIMCSLILMLCLLRFSERGHVSASVKLTSYVTIPVLLVAQSVLFVWTVMYMAGDDARGWAAIWLGVAMIAAAIAQVVAVARRAYSEQTTEHLI